MQNKKNKAQYDMQYQKTHMKRLTLWFNIEKDKDILDWLEQVDTSKSEAIKSLIRESITSGNGGSL